MTYPYTQYKNVNVRMTSGCYYHYVSIHYRNKERLRKKIDKFTPYFVHKISSLNENKVADVNNVDAANNAVNISFCSLVGDLIISKPKE